MALVATPVLVSWEILLWIAAGAFGAGFGLNSPITIDVIADSTEDEDRGLAMGMRITANRLAQVIQPVFFGLVGGLFGMTAGFVGGGVVMGAVLMWAAVLSRHVPTDR